MTAATRRKLLALGAIAVASGLVVATATAAIQASFSCTSDCVLAPGDTAAFVSSSSSSGPISGYAWDLDGDGLYGIQDDPDEPEGAGARSAERAFPAAGSFEVGLRVRNAAGESSTARRTVQVLAPQPPGPTEPAPPAPPVPAAPPPGVLPGPAAPPAFVPPLAFGDADGDRVEDGQDLCPGTARVMPARLRGCSVVDAMVAPAALLVSVRKSVAAAGDVTRRVAGTKRARARMARALELLAQAGARLPSSPCRAAGTAAVALRSATQGMHGLSEAIGQAQDALALRAYRRWRARHGAATGDADGFDLANAGLDLRRLRAREARADVAGLTGLIRAACTATQPRARVHVRARVTAIDPAAGLARLSDGTQLVYGAAAKATGLAQGALVSASGTALAGQVLVADAIEGGLVTKLLQPTCSFTPRIAPVQDFAQGNDEILYYDERGYRSGDGTYQLEGGMGLAAVRGSGCTADDYALDVYLDYTNADGKLVNRLLGALRGVEGFEPPLRIPTDVGKTAATLRFALWSLDCETPKDVTVCDTGQLEDKRSAPAVVRRQGAWGTATYDRATFSVEDGSTTDFDTATLAGVNAPALPGASVFGVGYAIAGGASQRPNRSYILQGQQFAVHDDVPTQAQPAGLLWAYVNGTRDGHPYHYVATLPHIVTDVVDFCPNKGPSLYRLPWKANTLQMVTQGNANEPTHSGGQRYAFDFKMPLLTFGYATRGGVVTLVEEKRVKQSNPKAVKYWKQVTGGKLDLWQPGNTLLIRHQDGTTSLYTHMMPSGILPEMGDVVERGDRITVTGATGNVTGPHLHYHVTSTGDDENAALGNTVPIRFEVAALPGQPIPCVVPKRGQAWLSTNGKPSS